MSDVSDLELNLEFPTMDVFLWQVYGISDFFTNIISLRIVFDVKPMYYDVRQTILL